jgi:glucokinase
LDKPSLIGDIGGTNARFAIVSCDVPGYVFEQVYPCADFPTLVDAIRFYLDQSGVSFPQSICLAVAGPVADEQVSLTNNPWSISVNELRRVFGSEMVHLLNDFEAIAWSIPGMTNDELLAIGALEPASLDMLDCSIAVIGPGTGLGAAGLRGYDGHFSAIVGEASHGGFAPESSEQVELLSVLRDRFERVSCERLVSSPGLENLYWALARIRGEDFTRLSAAEIFRAGRDESNPLARRAVELFYQILGQVAGDLALSLGARNGVYIAGGIARRYPRQLVNSRFRSGFESKGRHRSLMERIPTQLIMHEQPGLLGACSYARMNVSRPPLFCRERLFPRHASLKSVTADSCLNFYALSY